MLVAGAKRETPSGAYPTVVTVPTVPTESAESADKNARARARARAYTHLHTHTHARTLLHGVFTPHVSVLYCGIPFVPCALPVQCSRAAQVCKMGTRAVP